MKESKADVILHPVRMRIIQTLINGRKLTVQQIGEKLHDIPQATLYRHLNKLLQAKVIEVVEENPIRGAVEKVYALPEQAGSISPEEISKWTKEEHMDSFMKFISVVLADFERYVSQKEFDMQKDGAGYRQISFYATDEEYLEFLQTLSSAAVKLLQNEEGENRRKRTFTTIVTSENN
ncbi:helix-turn-helix domain-containing protein [Bacillus sp. FJAT-49732]|uniref:Helix-turn-helix domain-containing protein n=1 Tax=Lederbergia citrisecunda TaxID=2833583 RepID=A0A942TNW6_9BACI|nr:helix-turn-helix domain-containing protein [Lederbergia citrisecunda]MBS4201025.1 helix-turn-helix domain-containing protein [Lederbergia citrisecunda]